jgi:senataxin
MSSVTSIHARVVAEAPSYANRLLGKKEVRALCSSLTALLSSLDDPDLLVDAWPCTRASLVTPLLIEPVLEQLQSIVNELKLLSNEDCGKVAAEVLSKTSVVFCTLACSGNSTIRQMAQVDMIVIDEAAQALEGEALIPLDCRPKGMVLVGDPQQLPALTHSAAAREQGYGLSLLERLMKTCKHPYSLLNTQYRMHPAISQFPSKHFYDGAVADSTSVGLRPPLVPLQADVVDRRVGSKLATATPPSWLGRPYCFVDVATGGEEVMASRSVRNVAEAEACTVIIRRLIDAAAQNNSDGTDGGSGAQVLLGCVIMTFYAAQKAELEHQVKRAGLSGNVKVHTVDSFQGSEADVVVCSCVRSNPRGP